MGGIDNFLMHFFQFGLGLFTFRDVGVDGDVLLRFSLGVEERDDGRGNPVERAVLGAVANFAFPNAALHNRPPKCLDEFL